MSFIDDFKFFFMQPTEPKKLSKTKNWKDIIKTAQESGIHFLYSEELKFGHISGNGKRIKVTSKDSIEYVIRIINSLSK